jgi:hypothetical protein
MGLRMAASMRSLPWLRAEMWLGPRFCGGRVHLGVHNAHAQPLASRDGMSQSWFEGQAYPAGAATGVTPTGDALVDALAGGGDGLATLDGVYAIARYAPAANELVLATDRLGARPLYWAESERWFAYAGEVKALLAILDGLPDLDETAAVQFLSFDHMLGERTWWKGIQLVPPGSVWHVRPDGITRRRYWSPEQLQHGQHDGADLHGEFGRIFSRVIAQRRRPGHMPLLLSGGLDSRFLLAELRAQGTELTAITFGSRDCSDMRLARRCTRIAGVPHREVLITPDTWWRHHEEAIWQTDGLVNAIHLHVATALDELRSGNVHTLKNNSAGILFGGGWLRQFETDWRSDPALLLSTMYRRNPLFSADVAIEASRSDCAAYLVGPSADCFTLLQRGRRMTLTGEIAIRAHCEVENPAVALSVLQFVFGALGDEQRRGYRFYTSFLAGRYPHLFARIPSQKTGRGLAESRPVWFVNGVRGRVARMMGRELRNRYRDRFADYTALVQSSGMRERLLRGDLLLDEYLGGAARSALAAGNGAAGNGTAVDARTVMAILTAEIYLRQVVGARGVRDLSRYVLPSPNWPSSGTRTDSMIA